jgi:hypothetical protein
MVAIVEELKRRHIYRIGAAYVVVAWLLLQLYNNLTPLMNVPGWVGKLVLVLLIGGFPLALIFAWSLDLDSSRSVKRGASAAALPPFGGRDNGAPQGKAPVLPNSNEGAKAESSLNKPEARFQRRSGLRLSSCPSPI